MQSTYLINHGCGPCFFLKGGLICDGFRELEAYIACSVGQLAGGSRVILVISGHWEEDAPTVSASANPLLFYD